MRREASTTLDRWLSEDRRQPLVIRGARQVGKTWLVRDLAARSGLELVELNFERDPALAHAFGSNDPRRILGELGLALDRRIDASRALLFLDEVQAAGEVLATLRYFAEEMPELPVVAAGSLLEFTLADHDFSMPVGRISYLHLSPMTFPEYLAAHGREQLLEVLAGWRWGEALTETALASATDWFGRYAMVGGMPAVVVTDVEGAEASTVRRRQHDLLTTYLDDFGKYAGRVDKDLLDVTLRSVARQLGQKFVYASVAQGVRSDRARRALELLARARVCHIVRRSAAQGLPLGGEVSTRNRKAVLLDVGLAHALLATPAGRVFPAWDALAPSVRGGLAEQLTGQQILTLAPMWEAPQLYYWQRGAGRPGEIDYLVQVDSRIVPVEVKAGATGSLKSLHQFMFDKRLGVAVRSDARPPSVQDLDLETTQGDRVAYRLVTLPHSLLWRLPDAVQRAMAP